MSALKDINEQLYVVVYPRASGERLYSQRANSFQTFTSLSIARRQATLTEGKVFKATVTLGEEVPRG